MKRDEALIKANELLGDGAMVRHSSIVMNNGETNEQYEIGNLFKHGPEWWGGGDWEACFDSLKRFGIGNNGMLEASPENEAAHAK